MDFEVGHIYHVYNRGNNRDNIFYQEKNYLFFLEKVRKHLFPLCDILSYCLMPNHFHFLIRANTTTVQPPIKSKICNSRFGEELRVMLFSYTRTINKQENRTGSLFTQHTQAKPTQDFTLNIDYSSYCFYYILKNPLEAQIVSNLNDWPYSSFLDFVGLRNGSLCNQELTKELINADWDNLYQFIHDYEIDSDYIEEIFF